MKHDKELLKQIREELKKLWKDPMFYNSRYYIKCRLKGMKPSEIDYDTTHMFR